MVAYSWGQGDLEPQLEEDFQKPVWQEVAGAVSMEAQELILQHQQEQWEDSLDQVCNCRDFKRKMKMFRFCLQSLGSKHNDHIVF